MIGKRFTCPPSVCETCVIQIVGSEQNTGNSRQIKAIGKGDVLYWCAEVVNGKTRGPVLAVGEDELLSWEMVQEDSRRAEISAQREEWNRGTPQIG